MTRQQWLVLLVEKLNPLFEAAGWPLPPCFLDTGKIDGLTTAHYKEGTWYVTVTDTLDTKIDAAEALIHNLVFRATPHGETGQRLLMTLIGYGSTRPDGNKLAWGLKRLVKAMPPYPPQMTRAGWLTRLVDELRPLFEEAGHPLPAIKASPGWVSPGYPRSGMYQEAMGECYVFIWPQLSHSLDAAFALVKELPRCAVDVFGPDHTIREVATRIGLDDGEPTAALKFLLNHIIADLGPYPEN